MIELYFTACLLAHPTMCQQKQLTFSGEGLTPMQCMMGSEAQIASWVAANPKYFVTRRSCRPARMYSKA
jgi:hypothetical protein